MKNQFTKQELEDLNSKRKTVTLKFSKVKQNDSLGSFHSFKQPVTIEVKAIKPRADQTTAQVLACLVQDVVGNELDFSEVNMPPDIQLGDHATVDGTPASGDYVMADGSVWKFKDSKLVKIIPGAELNPLPAAAALMKDIDRFKKAFSE